MLFYAVCKFHYPSDPVNNRLVRYRLPAKQVVSSLVGTDFFYLATQTSTPSAVATTATNSWMIIVGGVPTFDTPTSFWFDLKFSFSWASFGQNWVAHTLLSAVSYWFKQFCTRKGSTTALIPSRHSWDLGEDTWPMAEGKCLAELYFRPYSKIVSKFNLALGGYSTCRAITSVLWPPREYSIPAVSTHHDLSDEQGFNYQFLLHSHPSHFAHTSYFQALVESLPPQLWNSHKTDNFRGRSQCSTIDSLLLVTQLQTTSLYAF